MTKWEKKCVIKEGNEKREKEENMEEVWKKKWMNDFKKGIVKKNVLQIMRVG